MSTKPRIYGYCPAGCMWETVHKEDFLKSCTYAVHYPNKDGKWYLENGKQYKIFGENNNGFGFTIAFKYTNNNGEQTYNFEIPNNDKYANSVVFKLLEARTDLSPDTLSLVYEIAGIRYTEEIETENPQLLTENYLVVENADKVYLYNSDASFVIDGGDSYTKEEIDDLIDNIETGGGADLTNYYKKSETYSKTEVDTIIDGLDIGGSDIVVDSALSKTSENPVQNKIITEALNNRYTKSETYSQQEVDNLISGIETGGSGTGGGTSVTVDTAFSDTSENPLQNSVITKAVKGQVLWENDRPSLSFEAQTVTYNVENPDYDFIEIIFKYSKDYNWVKSAFAPKGSQALLEVINTPNIINARLTGIIEGNSLEFKKSFFGQNGNESPNNEYTIPLKIIGYKRS